jgi:outer membrane protein OmpA-like peptidoglycan-associated protein/tetratricopeptide (TPR) repeat protein
LKTIINLRFPGCIYILCVFQFLFTGTLFAQNKSLCPESTNKKAVHYFDDAKDAKKSGKGYPKIKELLGKALEIDSTYAEAYHLLGDAAFTNHDESTMIEAYKKLIEFCPDASSDMYYRLGNSQYAAKQFEDAIKNLQTFLDFNKVKEENARDAVQKINRAKIMMHPVPFNPVPLANISGADPEYLAVISPDQDYCFFTRRFEELKKGSLTTYSVEKIMVSKKTDSVFDSGTPLPYPFNKGTGNNEGGASISIDNKHLFFTVNKNGNFDIYTSDEVKGKWTEPRSIGDKVNDNKQWDSQPSISPDGNTLYFASFRDSVNGTSDIFITKKDTAGNWSRPVSIGPPINTAGNEKTPFIHPDNKTLYFSTDFLPGMGGYDIWMSKLNPDGTRGTPVNLGYPINTEADEVGFFVSTDGKKGYYASNTLKGNGGYDIFEFDVPEKVKPDRVLFIKGNLKDETNVPINAKIELKNALTKEVINVNYDTLTGKYASVILFDEDYILTVKKKGYAFNSTYFSKKDSTISEPQKVNVQLKKVEVGMAYPLNNIHFASNSSELNEQDKVIITDFAEYLKINPSIKVSINGYTDNEGNQIDNLKLSEQRAAAVYKFLTENEIDKSRLAYKGYGVAQPLAPNTTEEGRAQNRRTEFVIIAK